jgi:hypothetical protein
MTPRDLLTAYDTAFRARFGRPCPPLGGKDAKLAKSLIGRYDEADLRRWLDAFFKSRDSFIQGSTYSLGVFSSCLGKIIAADARVRVTTESAEDAALRKADRARVEAEQEARWAAIRAQQAREAAEKAATQRAAEEAERARILAFRESRRKVG